MEQLSFAFPQTVTPSVLEIQTAPLPIQLRRLHQIVDVVWQERREQARRAEMVYWQTIADDNQLVLAFMDVGLTRQARRLGLLLLGLPA